MASKFVRRSGISVCLIAELLQWVPDTIYQVGIGCNPEETAVFLDAWPDVEIIGFEAHPEVYRTVKATYPGIIANLALGAHEGKVPIWSPPRHKDGSTVFEPIDADRCAVTETQMSTLDKMFIAGPNTCKTLLWLDCEGSELNVLRGGNNFLKGVEVVNVELTAKPIATTWCDSNQVHDHLLEQGFKRQWVHTQRSSAGQCDAIYVRPHLFRPEFCCCPCQIKTE